MNRETENAIAAFELDDDQQAAILYSPFREKSVNPASYNRKMTIWENRIIQKIQEEKRVSFNAQTIADTFKRKGMTPKCIPTVLEEMKRKGLITSVEDYNKSSGWLSWGFNTIVKQPLSWGVGQVLGSPSKVQNINYILLSQLKNYCETVLSLLQSQIQHEVTDCLIVYTEAKKLCEEILPLEQDFKLVLNQMERDKLIHVITMPDEELLIKFCNLHENKVEPIKDLDRQIFQIQQVEKKLEKEISRLNSRISKYKEEARELIKNNKKPVALRILKRKQIESKTLDRRYSSLEMIQSILMKIQDAQTNDMVLKACQSYTAAAKKMSQETNIETVEGVLDDVHEELANQDEVNSAMTSFKSPLDDTTDVELERELEELLNGGTEKRRTQTDTTNVSDSELLRQLENLTVTDLELPNVPSTSPSLKTSKTTQEVTEHAS